MAVSLVLKNLLFPVRPWYLYILALNIKNTAYSPESIFQKLMAWYGEWSLNEETYTVKIIRPRNTLKVLQSVASKSSVSVQLVQRKKHV